MARNKKRKNHLTKLESGAVIALYARASSDDERQEGSVEDQFAAMDEWAARKGYVVGDGLRFYDRMSGGSDVENRPGFREAMRAIRETPGAIRALVCKRIDRAFRDTFVGLTAQAMLEDHGCLFIGTDDPEVADDKHRAAHTMVRTVLMAAAQMQREITGEMIRDKQILKVKNGIHHSGKAPFGYVSAPRQHQLGSVSYAGWVPDVTTYGGKTIAEWVKWMFQETINPSGIIKDAHGRAAKTVNLMGMACYLTDQGVPTPSKLAWDQRDPVKREMSLKVRERNMKVWSQSTDLKRRFRRPYADAWDSSQLSDLLRSRAYIGEIPYNGDWFPARHPTLIDEATYEAAQLVLSKNAAFTQRRPTKRGDLLLSQMIACGGCGYAMRKHEVNEKKFTYRCSLAIRTRNGNCDNPVHRDVRVHQAAHRLLLAGLYEKWERISIIIPDPPSLTQGRDTERDELLKEKDRILRQNQKGWIGEEEAEVRLAPILKRLAEIDREREAPAERSRTKAEIETILKTIGDDWKTLPLALQQQVIRAYIPNGFTLYKNVLKATVAGIGMEMVVEAGEPSKSDVMPGWAGVVEVSRLLGKHENTVNYWCRNKKIPAVRLPNGKFRIPEAALVQTGGTWMVHPDAWTQCREAITAFEKTQKDGDDENKDGLPLEARQTVSVDSSPACGGGGVSRSGGIPTRKRTPSGFIRCLSRCRAG